MVNINIADLVGKNPVSYEQAKILYQKLTVSLGHEAVTLDFSDTKVIASPFFNGSIGLLLKDYSIESLKEKITFLNLNEHDKKILNIVIHNAIEHYSK